MSIDQALADTVAAAVTAALSAHTPRLVATVDEAARMLGVSPTTVRALLAAGRLDRLPGTGTAVRISVASVLRYAGWPLAAAPLAAPLTAMPALEAAS